MPQNQIEKRQISSRRNRNDRRSWQCQLDFPYVDSYGTLVSADRRYIVERRIMERRIEYTEYVTGDYRCGILDQFSN